MDRTVLYDLHAELGAKFVPFAGYEMPVQYAAGVMKEHLHTRAAAGLFDVSHMGQVIVSGPDAANSLERLCPQALKSLKPGRQRYAFFTDEDGGILDDLMVANTGEHLLLVVNAANKAANIEHLIAGLPDCDVTPVTDRALLALQGPAAAAALEAVAPGVAEMNFMDQKSVESGFGTLWVSRSGYTGEDGFEVSVPNDVAVAFARALLDQDSVEPIGLGARDSLRLEAGLCLHGSDIDPGTTPVEADLLWAMQKRRREEGGFPGAEMILGQIANGATRKRVGLSPEGRAPMRAGVQLFADETSAAPIGEITSGAFGPSVGAPISMGYIAISHAETGTRLFGELRGKRLPLTVSALPFHPHSYKR